MVNPAMRYRTKRTIFVFLFLAAGVFANSALSPVCSCGQACSWGFHPGSKTNIVIHLRCPGATCKSCDLEAHLATGVTQPVTPSVELHDLEVVFIAPKVNDYSLMNYAASVFQFNRVFLIFPSVPIYLENLSFLC